MTEFGKRCLVDHWDALLPEEKTKFVDLLEKNIKRRMNEKMLFTDEDANFVLQTTTIKTSKSQPIWVANNLKIRKGNFILSLALKPKADSYQIVDMDMEGALLSRNYRGQFNYLFRKYGKSGMLAKMEEKLAKQTP